MYEERIAQLPYALSANVYLTVANERVLIVNLRFIEEVEWTRERRRDQRVAM